MMAGTTPANMAPKNKMAMSAMKTQTTQEVGTPTPLLLPLVAPPRRAEGVLPTPAALVAAFNSALWKLKSLLIVSWR
jgi:hypothetical protein